MPLLTVGISHHTAPLETRERLAIGRDQYAPSIAELLEREDVSEAVILSTCNRTELYLTCAGDPSQQVRDWLARRGELSPAESESIFYVRHGEEAVRHLFQVACGLDSLVLGEPQIMGQLKQAWNEARDAGGAGKLTDRLFQRAFSISKEVRSETGINDHPVSVAYIAAILARQIFGDLGRKTVLMVGAGEMITLCGQHFHQHGVGRLLIANRSLDRAREVGEAFDAEPMGLDAIEGNLHEADVVICSTAATEPVIRQEWIRRALKRRRRNPVFMVDLGVPRDIEPGAADLDDVYLYTIDDLRQVADESLARRREAAEEAQDRIEAAVNEYLRWMHGARAAEGLRRLREHAEVNGEMLALRARNQIEAGNDPGEVLRQLSHTLTHRILHGPSTRLREAAEQRQDDILRAADWLFDAGLAGVPEDDAVTAAGDPEESPGSETPETLNNRPPQEAGSDGEEPFPSEEEQTRSARRRSGENARQ
jgi:glutamyl-tRNA reductase